MDLDRKHIKGSALVEVMVATIIIVGCLLGSTIIHNRAVAKRLDMQRFENILKANSPSRFYDDPFERELSIKRYDLQRGIVEVEVSVIDQISSDVLYKATRIELEN